MQPIPIEEMQLGEFYDVENRDGRVFTALLLFKLPNHQAKLLFMNNSDSDREFTTQGTRALLRQRSLQLETVELSAVYPFQTLSSIPTILRWPSDYENEELIKQISDEMRRTVSEGLWTFSLPHFLDCYLHIYLSYLRWRIDCPMREDRCVLWFQFMSSYFAALRDHLLRVQLLPEVSIRAIVAAVKSMDQLAEKSMDIQLSERSLKSQLSEIVHIPDQQEVLPASRTIQSDLKHLKNSALNAYKPPELCSDELNNMWKCMREEYQQDMMNSMGCEPFTIRSLLLDSPNLIGILSRHREYLKALSDADFPGLLPEEIIIVKLRIAVFVIKAYPNSTFKEECRHSIQLAEALIMYYDDFHLPLESVCRVFLEETVFEHFLQSDSYLLMDFVLTRTEMLPLVIAYLNKRPPRPIEFKWFLKCLSSRISVQDWEFIAYVSREKILTFIIRPIDGDCVEMYQYVKQLFLFSLDHQMSAELLRDLLPSERYGYLVFPILFERLELPRFREVMIAYLRAEQKYTHPRGAFTSQTRSSILRFLTATIALEDWEVIGLVIQRYGFSPACWKDDIFDTDQMHEDVKELLRVALEHKMSAELLGRLLPCWTYGDLVFPTLVERFKLHHCRQVMLTYFKPEQWLNDNNNPRSQERLFNFFKTVTARIALEDWEFVTFVIKNRLKPAAQPFVLEDQKMYECVKEIVRVALEHKMNAFLIKDLLPCVDYGHFLFPAMAEMFSLPHCREVMITLFSIRQWRTDTNVYHGELRFLNFLKCMNIRIACEDWDFIAFITNFSLLPAVDHSMIDTQLIYSHLRSIISVAIDHKMSEALLNKLLPCADFGEFLFPAFLKEFFGIRCRQMMISYFGSESQCITIARKLLQPAPSQKGRQRWPRSNREGEVLGSQDISQFLKDQKLILWYVFGASVRMQFIWVRQSAQISINRLSPDLTREICDYLV